MRKKTRTKLKSARQEKIRRKRVVWVKVGITALLFICLSYLVYFVDPYRQGVIYLFFGTLFFLTISFLSIFIRKKRRVYMIAIVVVLALFLRYLGVGSYFNVGLLVSSFLLFEFYFIKTIDS